MKQIPLLWPRTIFAALLLLVTFLTLTPNPENTEAGFAFTRWIAALLFGDAGFADKVAHFLAYAALGAAAAWAQLALFTKRRVTALALALYGILLEIIQGLGGVRSPEVADAVANALGAISGLGGAIILAHLIRRMRAS